MDKDWARRNFELDFPAEFWYKFPVSALKRTRVSESVAC